MPRLNVAAFSQGVSTACRWMQKSGIKADNLILWGGFFPPDFIFESWNSVFDKVIIIAGSSDNFLTPEKLKEGVKLLEHYSVNASVEIFEGGHEMKERTVTKILSAYNL